MQCNTLDHWQIKIKMQYYTLTNARVKNLEIEQLRNLRGNYTQINIVANFYSNSLSLCLYYMQQNDAQNFINLSSWQIEGENRISVLVPPP